MVRLISARQVVVQFDGVSIDLFYAGKVYTYDGEAGFKYLPVPRKITTIPAWTMIDVDSQGTGPNITQDMRIWPIQASPPNPVR